MKQWYGELECVDCGWRHFFIQRTSEAASVRAEYEKLCKCEECGGRRELVIGNTKDNPLPIELR